MGLFNLQKEEKPERFIEKSSQYIGDEYYLAVLVDTQTGVNYAFTGGDTSTLTPLVDKDGKILADEMPKNFGEPIVD